MSIFDSLGGRNQRQAQFPQGRQRNLAPDLLQHIQNFQGNPMEMLQEKVKSSGITQDQYDQLHNAAEKIARQMMGVLPR